MDNKYLLVVERSESQLTISKEDNNYVLEGTFTEFGVRNNNNRIYDKKEVMPHINELKKLCEGNKLLGELDHPKSFDISLKNASHVIEDIRFDEANNRVTGRIRLLNTDAGKNAKALVDAGVPLHISSRAAGVVENNGHVKIKKMFTYDLVANPGFTNAELKRVNESYGFDDNDPIQLFEVPWTIMDEKTTEIKENKAMDSSKFISIEDFNQYTKLIKNEFESMKKSLEEAKNEAKEPKLNEGLVKYTESIAKQVNVLQDALDRVNESVEGLVSHNDYIVENLEKVKDYAEHIGVRSNQGINYSEKLAESVDHLIEYTKMVAEKADQNIEYTKYVANESSNRWSYQNHINEQLDNVISHNDYIVEGMDSIIKYAEYGINESEKLQGFVDYVVKGINESLSSGEFTQIEEKKEVKTEKVEVKPIIESIETELSEEEKYRNTISSQLSSILESAKVENEKAIAADKLHFLNFLTESKRGEFEGLSEEMKNKVVDRFSTSKYFGTADAERIWESVFVANNTPKKLDWLMNMPAKYVSSWNSLTESQKNAIKAQASVKLLETQYQIDNFWSTRDLRESKVENENIERPINESSEYKTDDAYMNSVLAGFRQRFKK